MKRNTQAGIVLLVLIVAGFGIVSAFTDRSEDGDETAAEPKTGAGEDYDPFGGGIQGMEQGGADAPKAVPNNPPTDLESGMNAPEPIGDPVADGQEVPVTIPYRTGTKSRYRITTVIAGKDLRSGAAGARRVVYDTTVLVTKGDGSGTGVVRLTNEAFEMAVLTGTDPAGNTMGWRFDSRSPDERLLESDPQIRASLKAELANIDQPLEFTIGEKGGPTGVEGVKGWRDRFLTEMERVDPRFAAEAPYAPTDDLVEEIWGTHLFPTLGGGKLKGGETRKLFIREDSFNKGYVIHEVELRVTHANDDLVRVEATGNPGWLPRMGPARSSLEKAMHKCRVDGNAGSSRYVWHLDRKTGRLLEAWHSVNYRLWRSWRVGQSAPTSKDTLDDFGRDFTQIQRIERVVLLPDEAPEKPKEETADPPEKTGSEPAKETESADAKDADAKDSDKQK